MQGNTLVLIEFTASWSVSVWKKSCLVPVPLFEKSYEKKDTENITEILASTFSALEKDNCPVSEVQLCLQPKNILIKKWEFPFSSKKKINNALSILLDAEIPRAENLEHLQFIAKKRAKNELTNIFTLSCLKSSLQKWHQLFSAYNAEIIHISFFPFPCLYSQAIEEETTLLAVFEQNIFLFTAHKNSVHNMEIAQFVSSGNTEKDKAFFDASLKLLLKEKQKSPIVLLNAEANDFLESIGRYGEVLPYRDESQKSLLYSFIHNPVLKKLSFVKKIQDILLSLQKVRSIGSVLAFNMLCPYKKIRFPRFSWKNKARTSDKAKNALTSKWLTVEYFPLYPIAFCGLLFIGSLFSKLHGIQKEISVYEQEITRIYQKAAPQSPKFSSFRQMKSVILGKIAPEENQADNDKLLQALSMVSSCFPHAKIIMLEHFSFNKNTVNLKGKIRHLEDLEKFKQQLAEKENLGNVRINQTSIIHNNPDFQVDFEIGFDIAE